MAKGVYKKPSGKFIAVTWDSRGELSYHGTYLTEAEAVKARASLAIKHHWSGLVPTPEVYGFIYKVVDHDTEEMYIGRKVYRYYNKATMERDIESDWEFYTSSSRYVQDAVDKGHILSYEIIANLDSNDESSLMEHQLISKYFMAKLASGKRLLLNKMCPKIFSRGIEEASVAIEGKMIKILEEMP